MPNQPYFRVKSVLSKSNYRIIAFSVLTIMNGKTSLIMRGEKFRCILIILFVFLFDVCIGQSVSVGKIGPEGKALLKYIDPEALKNLVDQPTDSIWILDVRSQKAYENGHIPTAKSFSAGEVLKRLDEIPKDKYLIIYCTVGANAAIVQKKLKKVGYKRTMDWGGLSRWKWKKETGNPK